MPLASEFLIQPAILHIERMSYLLQDDERIRIETRVLALRYDMVEYLIYICHVEVAAKQQILRPPVVAAQERMHIRQPGLAGCAITQMPHVYLTYKGKVFFYPLYIGVVMRSLHNGFLHSIEDFLYGICAQGSLTIDKLLGRPSMKFYTRQSGTFLPPIVLFLHEQHQFIETIHIGTIFLFVVRKRFEQANQSNAAFVFERL